METALNLAEKGRGFTSPNPMVGAVVVKHGQIVGTGYHERAGGPHAEVNAINDARADAQDATLYVTLEPCNHTGRTPPCTHKILESRIKHVVVATNDPNPDVTGNGIDYLRHNGVSVTTGVCSDRSQKLNEIFIKYITTKRPFVIVKCASTLDGQIATRTGDSKWITNEHSRAYVHRIRHSVDAIMVGIRTVQKDNPSLTTRLNDMQGLDPHRIILDTHLKIPENARLLQQKSEAKTFIVCSESASEDKIKRLEKQGACIIKTSLKNRLIDLEKLTEQLGAAGITGILVEGGSRVIASALVSGIADKILFFYAPKIMGGNDGVPICKGKGPDLIKDCIKVKDTRIRQFGQDVLIEGYTG